jgi:cytochrome b6-f complex iron-sulfur subunit
MAGTGSGAEGASTPDVLAAPKRNVDHTPSRRSFLRASWLVGTLGMAGAFGGASLAFLWPTVSGRFGAELDVGDQEEILAIIRENRGPFPYPAGRMYLVAYDPAEDPDGQYSDAVGEGAQVMALYQKCVHLGCRVPWCQTAQWYQCPCHGSNYNRWGEWQIGPAPRGLDRFPVRVENGRVLVNTNPAQLITGPNRQSPVLRQPQEGPSCV